MNELLSQLFRLSWFSKILCSQCFCVLKISSNDVSVVFCLNMIFKVLVLESSSPFNFCSYLDAWLGSRSVVRSYIRPSIHSPSLHSSTQATPTLGTNPSGAKADGARFGNKTGLQKQAAPILGTNARGAHFGHKNMRCPFWYIQAYWFLIYRGAAFPDTSKPIISHLPKLLISFFSRSAPSIYIPKL